VFFLKNYSDFYKTINCHRNSYFIGANTPRGFAYADRDLFDESRLTQLYIIKGGPGTGKSTLMKKCRAHFEGKGCTVYSYYCSSDPTSLDAIIIETDKNRIAIVDGTSPHSIDAALPGAVSEIVDLGAFWDSEMLHGQLDRIAAASALKSIAFDNARRYIASAGEINAILKKAAKRGFDEAKARKFIHRLISSLPKQKTSCETSKVATQALSMKGAVRLPSFESADSVIGVTDFAGTAPLFFKMLADIIEASGISIAISFSPLGDVAEIYLPVQSIAFVPARQGMEYAKLIRLSRFADKDFFSSCTGKRRFNERCLLEMLDGALTCLAEAKAYHFTLEDIYVSSMDFSKLDTTCEKLIKNIEVLLKKA